MGYNLQWSKHYLHGFAPPQMCFQADDMSLDRCQDIDAIQKGHRKHVHHLSPSSIMDEM
jgi:hypothetical protein